MIHTVAVRNYRSLLNVVVPLGPITIVTGANGTGKSSLYRVLRLLHDNASGHMVRSLAREGGFGAAYWAGPSVIVDRTRTGELPPQGLHDKRPKRLLLGFSGDLFGYAVDLGYEAGNGPFSSDPIIKRELLWMGASLAEGTLMADRRGGRVKARDRDGVTRELRAQIHHAESMLTEVSDPVAAPEVQLLRDHIRGWRFYDHLRTDPEAPARKPSVGTFTPVLAADGSDLGAAIVTLRHVGDGEGFDAAIHDAFPGSRIAVDRMGDMFTVRMHQHGLLRPLDVRELSEGTLRYILWAVALFTPRPPPLMVLNEPETSLHPDLLEPLARMIARASLQMQVWVVSHHPRLVDALAKERDLVAVRLSKKMGATEVHATGHRSSPPWAWPAR